MIGLAALPTAVTLPNIDQQIDEQGSCFGERKESIEENIGKLIDELDFFSTAVIAKKDKISSSIYWWIIDNTV